MSAHRFIWTISLLHCLLLVGNTAWGQSIPERFKRKYEAGYPGQSTMSNVWPTKEGYFTLIMKIDSSGPGAYYWGMETVILDSAFEIVSRRSYGDTSNYYLRYTTEKLTAPDDKGNFWYWGQSYFPSSNIGAQYYGKFDAHGDRIFEFVIPDSVGSKILYELVALPGGRAVLSDQQFWGVFGDRAVLHFFDSLGIVYTRDTIRALPGGYEISASDLTVDTLRRTLIVPTHDLIYYNISDHYDIKPRLFLYDYEGNRLMSRNLNDVLHNHLLGPFYRTPDGRYFGKMTKIAEDSTGNMFGTQPGVVMLDSNFNLLWKRYLLVPNFSNVASSFQQGLNGEYYMGGRTDVYPSDSLQYVNWFIMKFSPKFDSVWTRRYNVDGHDLPYIDQACKQIVPMEDGRLLCMVTQFSAYSCSYLYMLDECGYLTRECLPTEQPPSDTLYPDPKGGLIAYPNPSDGFFELVWDVNHGERCALRVVDLTGRLLMTTDISREDHPTQLDLRELASGVYLVEIISEQGRRFLTKVWVAR